MSVLLRVAAILLIDLLLILMLPVVFTLAGRRRISLPLESGISRSFERVAAVGTSAHRGERLLEVSH
jgi:hypothetical protein